ncbi:MAG TPA: universal stress protein [Pseudoxanthomonas sp.]|nr:universal stress protein [Pseudoxanthomonas sp.]
MYKRILIAIDGSELAERGLRQGLQLAAETGAAVDIVTVSEPWALGVYDAMGWTLGYEASPEYRKEREEQAQAILAPALQAADAAGVTANAHHVPERYAADGILQAVNDCGSDLIVMTSHGRRGVSRVLLGSQTIQVLTFSSVPVLVVR